MQAVKRREKIVENLKKAEGIFQEIVMDTWLHRRQEVLEKV